MAVFRGGGGYYIAQQKLKDGELPISENNDCSVLWGQKTRHPVTGGKVTHLGQGWQLGDFIVCGWKPYWSAWVSTVLVPLSLAFTMTLGYFFHGHDPENYFFFSDWRLAILFSVSTVFIYYAAFHARFPRFVIFDRRHGLVHLPRFFSRRQDSIRWQDADFCIIDTRGGYLMDKTATVLLTAPPPWDLRSQGCCKPWKQIMFGMGEGDDPDNADAEPAFRNIVRFMMEPPSKGVPLKDLVDTDCAISSQYKNNLRLFRTKLGRETSLLDPERLPSKPNWIKDRFGNWKKVGPGACARAGWFGLWGQTHTLPPHLRGTKADPAYRQDPNAPDPADRWFTREEDPDGTGELVSQPQEVIEAVLREGMPALDRFPSAKARAERTRADALARQAISPAASPDQEQPIKVALSGEARSAIKKGVLFTVLVGGALALGIIGGLTVQ